jgi:hypothetical protein
MPDSKNAIAGAAIALVLAAAGCIVVFGLRPVWRGRSLSARANAAFEKAD